MVPTPSSIAGEVAKCGLKMFSFFENVTSRLPLSPIKLRTFPYCCVTQIIGGDGIWFDPATNGEPVPLRVGDWIIVTPGYPHYYGRRIERFTEDSVTFDGPVAQTLLRTGMLHSGIIHGGKERRLLPVIRALRKATLGDQLEAHALLLTLLLDLCRAAEGEGAAHGRINGLLQELQQSGRAWTVAEMAEYCNWSENYFRRRFQAQTGMSPKEYLDQRWYQRAIELLAVREPAIAKVAKQLGFDDPFYFSRRFRELSGMTPTAYRRRYAIS
ncbi:MAG: helix-turn-helix domain-containing protein [Victivallaceae bacterium]